MPDEPNTRTDFPAGLPSNDPVVEVPERYRCVFTVMDPDQRPIPHLPLLVTSLSDRLYVTDAAFDLASQSPGPEGQVVFVETRSDGAGRVEVRVPLLAGAKQPSAVVAVCSRSPAWFGASGNFYASESVPAPPPRTFRFEPGVAFELRVTERRTGKPIEGAYVRVVRRTEATLDGFGDDFRPVNTKIRMRRMGPLSRPWDAQIVVTSKAHVPAVATVSIPAGLHETRVDFVLDRADDLGARGRVELTVPGGDGEPGKATPWSLEVGVADAIPPIRVDILDATTWATRDRIDASLPPGRWRLRLLPEGRNSIAYEATVDVAARVTSRVEMTVPPSGAPVR